PVAQKDHQNQGREHQPDQDRISHALDGIVHNFRLVIEWPQLDSAWERLPDALNFAIDFTGNQHRIAVRLAVYVQENRWLLIWSNDGIDRFHRGENRGDISNVQGDPRRGRFHRDVRYLCRCPRLAAYQP